jgi:hypothetical protein
VTLDCPGCQSKLKLDPGKLPAGATTAVCPKCKTRILLPGIPPDGSITVQCARCSARLKVIVARLKPGVSKSKCPKCGQSVDLPAAPPGAAAAPPPSPAPSSEAAAAMTRRLDPREMGLVLGGGTPTETGGGEEQMDASASAPISVDAPVPGSLERSSEDLSKLIDEKVDGLAASTVPRAQAPAADAGPEGKAAAEPSAPEIQITRSQTQEPRPDILSRRSPPPSDTGRQVRPGASSSGARSSAARPGKAPSGGFTSPLLGDASPSAPSSSPFMPLLIGGLVSGSAVGGVGAALWSYIPSGFLPVLPETVSAALGARLGAVVVTLLLTVIGALLGGIALPPPGASGGSAISIFRCAVATGMLGLLAGVLLTVLAGGFDPMPTLTWTANLAIAGILTGLIARALSGRG